MITAGDDFEFHSRHGRTRQQSRRYIEGRGKKDQIAELTKGNSVTSTKVQILLPSLTDLEFFSTCCDSVRKIKGDSPNLVLHFIWPKAMISPREKKPNLRFRMHAG